MYPQSQQLVGYIDSQLSYGVAVAYIRQVLLQAGWPLPIVDNSLNQELAHTAHILPMPLDTNAYYSSAAPQYYSPQPAVVSHYRQPVSAGRAVTRFAMMSLLITLLAAGPVTFAGGWLLLIALTSGSFGINALAPYVLVCTVAWTILIVVRLLPAPFIASLQPEMTLRQVLGRCWNKKR